MNERTRRYWEEVFADVDVAPHEARLAAARGILARLYGFTLRPVTGVGRCDDCAANAPAQRGDGAEERVPERALTRIGSVSVCLACAHARERAKGRAA